MVVVNGEKYACEACVRGHRVSSCNHSERPLMHVNKKGRPVSQCQHCRGLRKSRAQHVKCDCADNGHTKENCPLENAEHKDHTTCCCGHGSRCNCALKKEHLDTVPEDLPNGLRGPHAHTKDTHKHRLSSLNNHKSEMTVFQNGHHKPVHKINDAHNNCGAPYKIPARSHTVHGHREIARKSSDSLPLTKTSLTSHETPQHHDSVTSAPQPVRQVKSEHGSPELKALDTFDPASGGLIMPLLDPNAYSYSPFENNTPPPGQAAPHDYQFPEQFPDQFPDTWFMSFEQAQTYEPGMNTAGLTDSHHEVDWSKYNFSTNSTNNNLNGHPPSYGSHDHYSHLSHPGLTSSSGDVSEGDEYPSVSRPTTYRDNSQLSNDISSVADHEDTTPSTEPYRLSTASSYAGTPQAKILGSSNLQSLNIDDYIKQAEEQTRLMALHNAQAQKDRTKVSPIHQVSMPDGQQQLSTYASTQSELMHPFTVHEAQTYAHMAENQETSQTSMTIGGKPFMTLSGFDDPMWSQSPVTPGVGLEADDDAFDLLQ